MKRLLAAILLSGCSGVTESSEGYSVMLVRDLTDSLYNPRKHPYVSHDRGTELVVEHIERYWCPSVLSADVVTSR